VHVNDSVASTATQMHLGSVSEESKSQCIGYDNDGCKDLRSLGQSARSDGPHTLLSIFRLLIIFALLSRLFSCRLTDSSIAALFSAEALDLLPFETIVSSYTDSQG